MAAAAAAATDKGANAVRELLLNPAAAQQQAELILNLIAEAAEGRESFNVISDVIQVGAVASEGFRRRARRWDAARCGAARAALRSLRCALLLLGCAPLQCGLRSNTQHCPPNPPPTKPNTTKVTIAGGVGQPAVKRLAYDLCRAAPLLDADYALLLDGVRVSG